jgi:hypothetical protein
MVWKLVACKEKWLYNTAIIVWARKKFGEETKVSKNDGRMLTIPVMDYHRLYVLLFLGSRQISISGITKKSGLVNLYRKLTSTLYLENQLITPRTCGFRRLISQENWIYDMFFNVCGICGVVLQTLVAVDYRRLYHYIILLARNFYCLVWSFLNSPLFMLYEMSFNFLGTFTWNNRHFSRKRLISSVMPEYYLTFFVNDFVFSYTLSWRI